MKTITEYQPLIFGVMLARTRARAINRRAMGVNLIVAVAYALVGYGLTLDLKASLLEWQFWIVFGPLFVAAELLISEMGCWVDREVRAGDRAVTGAFANRRSATSPAPNLPNRIPAPAESCSPS